MSKWTEAELNALQRTANDSGMSGYHAFGALTSYSKSFNAWEVKRRRFLAESSEVSIRPTNPAPLPAAFRGVESDFVGLNIAYWDLETTFSTQPIVLYGAIADVFGNVRGFEKGPDITDDRELVSSIADALSEYDVWVTWNGKLFDVPVLNARLRFHGLRPLPLVKHIDAMYYASGNSMRLGRRSLQSVSEYFDVPNRKTPLSVRTWDKAMSGDVDAYGKIIEHCDADTLVLRDVFSVLKSQIANIHR